MKKLVLVPLAAAALAAPMFAFAAAGASDNAAPAAGPTGAMSEPSGFMLDARLAGMKAALKLTPEQEKFWAPFEAAVRDAAKARREQMRAMHEAMRSQDHATPIDHMNAIADRLAKASTELKVIAGAAKPLFDSLDETQKHHFGALLMTLREHGGEGGHMMMGHRERGGPDDAN